MGKIKVEFESSYEPNGPFGAKSIGEVVINTPLPAISDAIYNAIGTRFYELPITPEKIAMAVAKKAERCIRSKQKFFRFLRKRDMLFLWWAAAEKTTLMYANLAAHCARKGWRVLVTTTTHIMQPPGTGLGTDGCRAFSACGSAAVMPWPEPLHPAAN